MWQQAVLHSVHSTEFADQLHVFYPFNNRHVCCGATELWNRPDIKCLVHSCRNSLFLVVGLKSIARQLGLVGNCMMERNGFHNLFSLLTLLFTLHVIICSCHFSSLSCLHCLSNWQSTKNKKDAIATGIACFMQQNLHVTQISSCQR